MPKKKFWTQVVQSVFELEGKEHLRKAKVCKRAVHLARSVLPDVSKEDLGKEIESHLDALISNGTVKNKGEKLSLSDKKGKAARKGAAYLIPARTNSSDKENPSKRRKLSHGQQSQGIAKAQDVERQEVSRQRMGGEQQEPEIRKQGHKGSLPASEGRVDSGNDYKNFAEKRKRKKKQQNSSAAAAPMAEMPSIESEDTPSAKRGKWTKGELSALVEAAAEYGRQHNLSDKDFSWLIHSRTDAHKEAWQAIRSSVPHRTARAVRRAATRALRDTCEEEGKVQQGRRHAIEDATRWRQSQKRKDVKAGRFTSAEKDILRKAVIALAQEKGCSTSDFSWLLNKDLGDKRTRDWIKIATALPHRTALSVWHCGNRILHPDRLKGKYSEEDDKMLMRLVESHGKAWKLIGRELERTPAACRDRHRILATSTPKRLQGGWSADECRRLVDAIQEYLCAKQAVEESAKTATLSVEDVPSPGADAREDKLDRRVILDDINWDLVAEKVVTRDRQQCMTKWYRGLAPSMVTTGEWGSGDDRRLLKSLLRTGARQVFDVDWGAVVDGRTEKQTRRRWRLMTRHVPDANDLEFEEHLEFLARKFTPDLWARYRGGGKADDEERREERDNGEGNVEQED